MSLLHHITAFTDRLLEVSASFFFLAIYSTAASTFTQTFPVFLVLMIPNCVPYFETSPSCWPLSLQMNRPIQVKPADSESRGGKRRPSAPGKHSTCSNTPRKVRLNKLWWSLKWWARIKATICRCQGTIHFNTKDLIVLSTDYCFTKFRYLLKWMLTWMFSLLSNYTKVHISCFQRPKG